MAKVTSTPRPDYEARINADLRRVPPAAAEAFALTLYEALDSEAHGKGVHYPHLPNRSSTPMQLPVKQSGDLQNDVDYGPYDELTWWAGLKPKSAERIRIDRTLEYGSAEIAYRAPVRRIGVDRRTLANMNTAVAKLFGGNR